MVESTQRFSGLADVYAKARPTYPPAAIDYIMNRCSLKAGDTIADVGCGTGISSALFAERELNVIGVEPNDDMREKANDIKNSLKSGHLELVKGTAEATSLENERVSAVVCAQAFHWFKAEIALTEFHRILKQNGWTFLMWNERDESDAFTMAYGDAFRTMTEIDTIEAGHGSAGIPLLSFESYQNSELTHVANEQVLDREMLILRAFSSSYAPKEEVQANRLKELLFSIFDKFQTNETVSLKYKVSIYSAQKK